MIEKRREQRVPAEFIVKVVGRDDAGNAFLQSVGVHNISHSGALLTGIEHKLRCGDVIEIRLVDKAARFRVVWTLDSGCQQRKILAAVHLLDGQKCPWSEEVERRLSLATAQN